MSVEVSALKLQPKGESSGFLRTRIVGMMAAVVVSILVSATVWMLATVLPSKTGSPFAPIRDICEWIYRSSVGTGIRESALGFPLIEGVHLLGISLSVGLLCWFDLRLLGLVMTHEPISK